MPRAGVDGTGVDGSRVDGSRVEAPRAPSAAMMDSPFGPACASVPADRRRLLRRHGQDPVATAASNNPALSTLVTAVAAAGLVDTLNSAEDITVFAPTNDGFAASTRPRSTPPWPIRTVC